MIKFFKNFYSTDDFIGSIETQTILPKYVRKESYIKSDKNANYPELYVTCWSNRQLIGCLKQICIPTYEYKNYFKHESISFYRTIMFISVLDEYKNNGIATKLISNYFQFYKDHELSDEVVLSPFSAEGFKFIRHKIKMLSYEFNIKIKDSYCFET